MSCDKDFIFDFTLPNTSNLKNVEEAKHWFEKIIILQRKSVRTTEFLMHKRLPAWDKAKDWYFETEGECLLIPIHYEDKNRPCFLYWDEDTAFKEKLGNYYALPIYEFLIIYQDDLGNNQAFLYQVAYDRFRLRDKWLDFEYFNGCVLKADWNDTLLYGEIYKEGKKLLSLIFIIQKMLE